LLRLPIFTDAQHAGKYADDAADRTSQHAANRSGGLVARLGALLNALNQPLRVSRGGHVEKHHDSGPKHKAQSRLRSRRRCWADHSLVSMGRRAEKFGAVRLLPNLDILIVFAPG
jgi:hypothetical protein